MLQALDSASLAKSIGAGRGMDLIVDGNLGTSFLERYDVTLDLLHALAWVAPTAGRGP